MECEPQHAGRQLKCPACSHKIVVPPDPENKVPAAPPQDQTWTTDVPSPDVTLPTRYASPKDQKPPPQSE